MQVSQRPYIFKEILFWSMGCKRAASFSKGVSPVAGKAARKISTRGGLVWSSHCYLITVVKLRDTAGCKHKQISQL
jgi:hypothetical protein